MDEKSKVVAISVMALLLSGGAASAVAATEKHECIARIMLTAGSVEVDQVAAGFSPIISKTSIALTGVSLFDGPPDEGAMLKPISVMATASGSRIKWDLAGGDARGTWIACDYSDGLIRLVRRLSDVHEFCSAATRKSHVRTGIEARFVCP